MRKFFFNYVTENETEEGENSTETLLSLHDLYDSKRKLDSVFLMDSGSYGDPRFVT